MPIANVANMCAHLQNASRARLGLTSVPHTKYNLAVLTAMQRNGFISFLARGGKQPPDPASLSTYTPEPLTTANVASQRLWIGLKYGPSGVSGGGGPVLRSVKSISKPKRAITADLSSLERVARGMNARNPAGLSITGLNIGEAIFLSTDRGVLELREALRRKVGGLLLCRAGP